MCCGHSLNLYFTEAEMAVQSHGSQLWLYIRVTQGTFKTYWCLGLAQAEGPTGSWLSETLDPYLSEFRARALKAQPYFSPNGKFTGCGQFWDGICLLPSELGSSIPSHFLNDNFYHLLSVRYELCALSSVWWVLLQSFAVSPCSKLVWHPAFPDEVQPRLEWLSWQRLPLW